MTITKVLEGNTRPGHLLIEMFSTTIGGKWWPLHDLWKYKEHAQAELPEIYYDGRFWTLRRCARALYWLQQAWPTIEFRVIARDHGHEQELNVDGIVGRYSWEEQWHLQPPPL